MEMICNNFSQQPIFKILLKTLLFKDPFNFFLKDNSTHIKISKYTKKIYSSIVLKDNSTIEIEDNVVLENVSIICKGTSKLVIKENTKISNVSIKLDDNSQLVFGDNNLIGSVDKESMFINIYNGSALIGSKSKLYLKHLQVRFGGRLSIGKFAGIGDQSEIRCDESITIGDFLLCSYNVSIYDTNVHSVNSSTRNKEIIDQFPSGLSDSKKPKTAAVVLGNNIWLGKNSAILKGSILASDTIVGMNTTISNIQEQKTKTFTTTKPRSF